MSECQSHGMRWASIRSVATGIWRSGMTNLEDALMPRRCVFCGVVSLADERYICRECYADLPWIRHSCPTCAIELPSSVASGVACAQCQARPPPFTNAVAPLDYAFPVDAAVKALKFRRKLFFVPGFAEVLLASVSQLPPDIDALLPVPLHRWRQLRRGFNQASELAKPIAKATGLPLIHDVQRTIATPYQSGLNARARRQNLKAAFTVDRRIDARHILIVDDVITTGETGRHLAKALLEGGADEVSIIAVARA